MAIKIETLNHRGAPNSLKLFARRIAMRLTHEYFRADSQGLIKSIEAVIKRVSERQKIKELKEMMGTLKVYQQ